MPPPRCPGGGGHSILRQSLENPQLLRNRDAHAWETTARYDRWLDDALTCGVRAVETFARGLVQDGAAVRAAFTSPWSNGQTEGQITKLKLLKRQMYGRANLDPLRRRLLLAA